jgi:hypothetical protein
MTKIWAVLMLALSTPVWAQDKDPPPSQSPIVFGVKIEGGYAPNYWSHLEIGNFPAEFRTVVVPNEATRYNNAGFTHVFKPGEDNLEVKDIGWLVPLQGGLTINFFERIELSAGGLITFNPKESNRMQLGCYCVGSTVTYVEMTAATAIFGAYVDGSIRIAGPVWLNAEASFYPMWRDIAVVQGYSEYGGDYQVLKKDFGAYRIPQIVLGGLKFCPGCRNESERYAFGFRAGYGQWETRINPQYAGMTHPEHKRIFLVQAFGEFVQILGKRK